MVIRIHYENEAIDAIVIVFPKRSHFIFSRDIPNGEALLSFIRPIRFHVEPPNVNAGMRITVSAQTEQDGRLPPKIQAHHDELVVLRTKALRP